VAALAKRKDLRALPILVELLQAESYSYCTEEAACSLLDLDMGDTERTADEYLKALRARFGSGNGILEP